jgi:hypothetical protein
VIIGTFGLNFVRLMPVIQVHLDLPGMTPTPVPINFLVDSGNTDSCIHPRDARNRLQIDSAVLERPLLGPNVRVTHGIGGTNMSFVHPQAFSSPGSMNWPWRRSRRGSGEERGRGQAEAVGGDGCDEGIKEAAALLLAGGGDGQDPFDEA